MAKVADYEMFGALIARAKKNRFERAPTSQLLEIMDPDADVVVKSFSRTEDKIRAIFEAKIIGVPQPLPIQIDMSESDFDNLSEGS